VVLFQQRFQFFDKVHMNLSCLFIEHPAALRRMAGDYEKCWHRRASPEVYLFVSYLSVL
jgi:hypothetical protein